VDYARPRELEVLPAPTRTLMAAVAPVSPAAAGPDLAWQPADPSATPPGLLAQAGVYFLRLLLVAIGLCAVLYGYQVLLGSPDPVHHPSRFSFIFPGRYFAYGAIFLTATTLLRRRELIMAVAVLPCLHNLYDQSPPLVAYVLILVPALYFLLGNDPRPSRRQSLCFWAALVFGLLFVPKAIQTGFRLDHASWLAVNEYFFVGLFLRYVYYFYERRRGLVAPGRFWEHASYLLFIPQLGGMLNFPPSEMAERWTFDFGALRRGFTSVGWAALEIPLVLWLGQAVLPAWGYSRGYAVLQHAGLGELWLCLLVSYLYWALLEITKFTLMVALFRFFGVNVDDNFRWPLLATSPVQLWRRWNIYSRKLLLKFVYFPLGGNRRYVYRNIVLTFLASALLLHTGFLGGPWISVDPGQLRDWVLYFAAQGLLVCAAYWWQNRPFWERVPGVWRTVLAGAGWAFTILSSAWLHVLPLAANELLDMNSAPLASLAGRVSLMLRALGL
jgi:hypothetical protein